MERYPEILFKYIKDIPKDYKGKCMLFSTQAYIGPTSALLLEIEKIIDTSDPVYTFCDVMDHIDLKSYFVEEGCKTDILFMYLLDGMEAFLHKK